MTDRRNDPTRRMNGGRAVAEMLNAYGGAPVWGMAGFQLLPFYDGVRALGMTHTLINDERCGAFAADAWARVTGRPGVVDATLGPGATNLLTALVESLNAGVPMIAVVGDANRTHAWKNMTQETRQIEMLAPAVKEVIRVEVGERIPEHVRRAFAVATGGRPGPVILDVPEDIAHGEFDFSEEALYVEEACKRIPSLRCRPDAAAVARAAAILDRAERPLLLAGGGIHLSEAWEPLRNFAETHGVPVAHTMSGKGALACTHPLSVGLFGRYDRIANGLIEESDALIAVGCKLGEIATKRYTLPPAHIPLIHLEIEAGEIGRAVRAEVGLWGDARAGLDDLAAACDARIDRSAWTGEAARRHAAWREEARARYESAETPVNMARLVHAIRTALPDDGILVADGGFAGHWTGLLYDTRQAGRTYIADRGFASIGYGLPGGMGAALAAGSRPVVALSGDGGFNMTLGEIETARRLGLGLTVAVVNNAASGYVKALQHAMYGGRYQSADLSETNYADAACALGCHGVRVEDPADLDAAFAEAIAERNRPSVVDVVVTRDPAQMLPGMDNRTAPKIERGDRIA